MPRTGTVGQQQKRAWGYYGYPGSPTLPVGEVRYIVGWHADQMTRLEWDVLIDGSEVWAVETEDGTISTTIQGADGEPDQDLTGASTKLLNLIGWTDENIRSVDTNLFVAGEGDYIKTKAGRWRTVSAVEPKRKETLEAADEVIPFLWPHPADPKKPDAPLFSVLELLESLEWLTRQSATQSKQRVLMNGIVLTADTLEGPDGKSFWDIWNETLSAKQVDPDDMSPVRVQAPSQDVKEGAVDWILPPFGYDQVLDRKITAAIERLAYGLPIPGEVLLGLQAPSRATAMELTESSYRAHIEPSSWLVAQVPQDALTVLLDDRTVEVRPNPSKMLARKQSVDDVKWAKDSGLVDNPYTREVLGIPEDAAPTATVEIDPVVERALDMATAAPSLAQSPGLPDLVAQLRSIVDGTPYEPVVSPDEPVTAAASSDDLSDLLADIDAHLSSELAGVTVMATDRARQRLGAAARSNESVRSDPDLKGLSSAQVAVRLGVDGLRAAGVRVDDLIAEPVDSATRWWVKRVGEAWEQASVLVPGWSGQGEWVEDSVAELAVSLSEHMLATLGEPDLSPLQAGDIRAVVDAAAGGS